MTPSNTNEAVSAFILNLNHPFSEEINLLRTYILDSHSMVVENIKWNGPNYELNGQDRITMRIQPPGKQVQLILHRGAKKQAQPAERLIPNTSKLLSWKENDRAVITFKSLSEIKSNQKELQLILSEWLEAGV